MNLARLNHILIPADRRGRDRLRLSPAGRLARPLVHLYEALSEEGRAVFLLWLVSGAVGVNVHANQLYLLWSGLAGLIIASVLLRGAFRMPDVALTIEVPPRVTAGEDVPLTAVLTNTGPREHQAVRVRGPLLPWDGRWTAPPPAVPRLAPGQTARAPLRARFSARGPHDLDRFTAQALVPLGLTQGPATRSGDVRFLVLPRLARVASLRLPTAARYQPGGVALASRTGESMELLGVRPYRPGDPVRDLHARLWARRGAPVVREYRQEYFTRVGVVLDTDRAAASEDAFEAAVSLTAGLVAHLIRDDALVDLLVLGDQLHRLPLGRSLGTLDQALDLLACVQRGPPLDPTRLLRDLEPHLPTLSCLVFVTPRRDDARRRFEAGVTAAGTPCRVVHLAARHPAPATDALTSLPLTDLQRALAEDRELHL